MPKQYSDIQISEGDQVLSYSREGIKCKRAWKVDSLDNSDPQATLYKMFQGGATDVSDKQAFPFRGCPHPSIVVPTFWGAYDDEENGNAFQADTLAIKGLTSTQAAAEVEYAVLNALTQEPSKNGDSAPALLHCSSSVHSSSVATDAIGQPLVAVYTAGGGYSSYDIYLTSSLESKVEFTGTDVEPFVPGSPSRKFTSSVEAPSMLLRFQRRETQPRDPRPFEGFVNSKPWKEVFGLGTGNIPARSCLCTRIESETQDAGVSYVVTYEFQFHPLVTLPGSYEAIAPAVADEVVPSTCSPWYASKYYELPSGSGRNAGTGKIELAPGQVPPDADLYIFQCYPECDFEAALQLVGRGPA